MLTQLRIRLLGTRMLGRKWYQHIDMGSGEGAVTAGSDSRARRRTDSFLAWIPRVVQPQDHVLDVGCNAGLFSFAAGEICRQVTGVEIDKHFLAQARFVQNTWRKQGRPVDRVQIIEADIAQRLDLLDQATLLLASKVLYHKWLAPHLHNLMAAVARSPIDRVLAQGHTTQGELGTTRGMQRLFAEYGFRCELLEDVDEYPIVLARRCG
jgi:SAM-dependent methyltransferase